MPNDQELLVRGLLRDAAEARENLAKFYSFVIRHETTQRKLVAAPHQELMFSFIQAHNETVLRIPAGFAKTTSMLALALWLLGRDVTQRGAIISRTRG